MATIKFFPGEKVLCYHGTLLYDAKCLVSVSKKKSNLYLIHYQVKQPEIPDEWVQEKRILKWTEANSKKQKELLRAHNRAKRQKRNLLPFKRWEPRRSSNASTSPEPLAEKGSGNKHQQSLQEENICCKLRIEVIIPNELKPKLIDDWDLIFRQKKLVILPAKVTVNKILERYRKSEKMACARETERHRGEVTAAATVIGRCFDAALGSRLLYKFERLQYAEVLKTNQGKLMSEIYGGIHLLRLFVLLGSLLRALPMDGEDAPAASTLLRHAHGVMRFLCTDNLISIDDYGLSPPEYRRQILGAD